MINQQTWHRTGNFFGLVIICLMLIIAFLDQLLKHDLPCPLCLLQRVCFVAAGLCLVMNLCQGIKPAHYGLMLFSALLGLSISVRQIYLHESPGDPGYGDIFLGLHFYAWAAISFIAMLSAIAVALLLDKGFETSLPVGLSPATKGLVWLFLLIILANGISTFQECGLNRCPDNPEKYKLLSLTLKG